VSCWSLLPIQSLSQFLDTFIGTGKGRVPWMELQRAQGNYIKPKYLPQQVALKQFYHLTRKDVNAILKHWTQRQAAGKVPFRFKNAAKAIQRNKPAPEENSADADMSPGEESEEDLQSDGGSQAWVDRALEGNGSSNSSTEQAHTSQNLGNAAETSSRVGCILKYVDNRC
jgi:hypothetical protein